MNTGIVKTFLCDCKGNLSVIFSVTLIPVVCMIGVAVDFTQSARRKVALDSIADSASLAAVTPSMLSQSDQTSINLATTLFSAQASSVAGVVGTTLSVNAQDNGLNRTVTVSYQATSQTLFGPLTGKSS